MNTLYIFDLSQQVSLAEAGGKGLNLHLLEEAGFNVPQGFIIGTAAYKEYVESNGLWSVIEESLREIDGVDTLLAASQKIREAFSKGTMPSDIRDEISVAYSGYDKVAVRSSATAEDLPDTSFAGQQDTYLNIEGEEALLRAVVDCWSSLWTSRAIGYRDKNRIRQDEVSLAVVVQSMVQSQSSGVMFTVNPLTGVRTETVINATFGLGDLLVSGQIEPDEYIVDEATSEIKSSKIGAKNDNSGRQSLSDEQIKELTEIGSRIHGIYGSPQDIEWAIVDGTFYILQSRPVTGLYPMLERVPVSPLRVYGSFAHIQGVLQPMTPMGRDVIRQTIGNVQNRFGGHFKLKENIRITSAGGRLYSNITQIVKNKRYHGVIRTVLGYVEPGTLAVIEPILEDPRIEKIDKFPSFGEFLQIVHGFGPVVLRVAGTIMRPVHSREDMNRRIKEDISYWTSAQKEQQSIEDHIKFIDRLLAETPVSLLKSIVPRLIAGIGSFYQVKGRAEDLGLNEDALNITRGLPYNVTTEMDLFLWEKTKKVKADEASRNALEADVEQIAANYREHKLPTVLQTELDDFLSKYGMRGVAEIDIGTKRWCDDPTHIIQLMQTYSRIDDPDREPDVVFERMAESAQESLDRIAVEAGKRGWLSRRLVRFFEFRQRNLAGLRESPKFFIINVLFVARNSLLDIGRMLVEEKTLDTPWDVFYLHLYELKENQRIEWRRLVTERKKQMQINAQKKPPRIILSDGHIYYGSVSSDGKNLMGSPVSPGVVEGVAHVILDPASEALEPGEILVCPATDPAWTPLFLAAGGLVMEVGGLMTHGSIVAREYGIPAVVGLNDATTLIKTGQRIRVDGEKGIVALLD
ncbi:hypothetical protein E2P71_05960 [Candidatus Bathyarchaeota archaeon]|nr:hypothetical protein E2P71_05960 [Candidatus Bathyarchaeota archaeon]